MQTEMLKMIGNKDQASASSNADDQKSLAESLKVRFRFRGTDYKYEPKEQL